MLVESVEQQYFVLKDTDRETQAEESTELYPGSSTRKVTRQNAAEFIALSVEAELNKTKH
jgi:hypothetical protein